MATAATVPVSMVAASQWWQGRRWRRWCWRERRWREESRCLAWPHPRQPSPRQPSALGTRRPPTRRQKRPPSRHRRPVLPTSGWRCGYRAWQGAAKSGSTPRVGRLHPADTGHPLGPCGRLRGVRPPENSFFFYHSLAGLIGGRSQPVATKGSTRAGQPTSRKGVGKGNAPVATRYNDRAPDPLWQLLHAIPYKRRQHGACSPMTHSFFIDFSSMNTRSVESVILDITLSV